MFLSLIFKRQVNCAGRPFDVTAPAITLADNLADAAMGQAHRASPHFVFFGEEHRSLSDLYLAAATIEQLSIRHPHLKVQLGLEYPENFPSWQLERINPAAQKLAAHLCYASPLPYLAFNNVRTFAMAGFAAQAAYFYDKGVPTHLTDEVIDESYNILVDGNLNIGPDDSRPIIWNFRNRKIWQNLERNAARENVDIAIQIAGAAHLLGSATRGYAYKDSLSGFATKSKRPHTVILPNAQTLNMSLCIPVIPAVYSEYLNAIAVEGLDSSTFQGNETSVAELALMKKFEESSSFRLPDPSLWQERAVAAVHRDLDATETKYKFLSAYRR